MDDLIIIGAGPAGLTASIYASCYHLTHKVIAPVMGGQMATAPDILNYPGFVETSGKELTDRMVEQAKARGGEIIEDSVTSIKQDGDLFTVLTGKGATFSTHAIILASGTERKKLNVPGELEYASKGVYYCATCEKQDYEGKVVGVVGGANSAAQSAVQLAQAASQVFILYRGTELRCDPEWMTHIQEHPNIQILYNTVVKEIVGNGAGVTGVNVLENQMEKMIGMEKIFIEIGGVPGTALVAPLGMTMDPGGFIQVNLSLETSVPGIFAAGDLVSHGLSLEQISTAVGLGARAAASAFTYIKKENIPSAWGKALINRPGK